MDEYQTRIIINHPNMIAHLEAEGFHIYSGGSVKPYGTLFLKHRTTKLRVVNKGQYTFNFNLLIDPEQRLDGLVSFSNHAEAYISCVSVPLLDPIFTLDDLARADELIEGYKRECETS